MQEQRYVYFQEIATKRQFHTATELAQDLTDIYQITGKIPENSGLLPPTYHLKDIKS